MTTVRVLYDFAGDAQNDELVLVEGDVLTITNQNVGEGWWEGQKSDGTIGLFPETYVEVVSDGTPASEGPAPVLDLPPPPTELPTDFSDDPFGLGIQPWSEAPPNSQEINDWPDDWDNTAQAPPAQPLSPTGSQRSMGAVSASPLKRSDRNTTIKITNIFSTFTKTAAETYILGEAKSESTESHKNVIVLAEDGPMWENNPEPFSCSVSDPVKESKFSGFKSYIAYNITPSTTNVAVQRRFKHFDWLYEQLSRKYGVSVSVPQLPDKQITGRYEDEFIEARRIQLQSWICRMALHPAVSRSDVFHHFITSKDDEKAWKAGKRKAERDDAVGGAFLHSVSIPDMKVDLTAAEQTLDTHLKFTRSMDEACKQIALVGQEFIKNFRGSYKNDHQRLGLSLVALSQSFELDERPVSHPLTDALKHTGAAYETVSKLYGDQPKLDWYPFLEGINEYKGVLATFPSILGNEKSAIDKQAELKKLLLENKVTSEEMEDVNLRTDKVIYAAQAEVNHFQHYRVGDFASYMLGLLNNQIEFHQKMVATLQETAELYRNMVPE